MKDGMAETLKLTPTESVTIRQSSPEVLEVEGSYGPGGKAHPTRCGTPTSSRPG